MLIARLMSRIERHIDKPGCKFILRRLELNKSISGNLITYSFGPKFVPRVGHNIFVLKSKSETILIDPAFDSMIEEMKTDSDFHFTEQGKIIISHYHDDHFSGVASLPRCTIFGSQKYRITLTESCPDHVSAIVRPSGDMEYGREYLFGENKIQFYEGRGHSVCGILTVINQEYIHINDIIGFSAAGVPILPLAFDSVPEYIKTINKISDFGLKILVPHMPEINQSSIIEQMNINLGYLEGITEHVGKFDLREYARKNGISFEYSGYHKKNIKHLGTQS
jgi:glyoxylase-like metal-dependent hydrolase (beta-lactamase superfamily II)